MVLGPQGPGRVGRRRFLCKRSSRPVTGGSIRLGDLRSPAQRGESVMAARAGRAATDSRGLSPGSRAHRRGGATMAIATRQRGEADLLAGGRLTCASPVGASPGGLKPLPVRMPAGDRGLLVDLPVDVLVVLDAQERAGRGKQRPGAACKVGLNGRSEHAFDCTRACGRNVGSTAWGAALGRKIGIVKRFLGRLDCKVDCNGRVGRGPAGRSLAVRLVMECCDDC
jgi:hypothetical protein